MITCRTPQGKHERRQSQIEKFRVFLQVGRFLLPHRAKVTWFPLSMLVATGTSLALPQALRQTTLALVGLGVLMMLAPLPRATPW